MIEAKGVTKSYGFGESKTDVLKGIDLQISEGDFRSVGFGKIDSSELPVGTGTGRRRKYCIRRLEYCGALRQSADQIPQG